MTHNSSELRISEDSQLYEPQDTTGLSAPKDMITDQNKTDSVIIFSPHIDGNKTVLPNCLKTTEVDVDFNKVG